jgi:hypothetical protein
LLSARNHPPKDSAAQRVNKADHRSCVLGNAHSDSPPDGLPIKLSFRPE